MIHPFGEQKPLIDDSALVVYSATVIGDVTIGAASGVWFNAVIRGDVGSVKIGARTNVQDGCVMHVPWGGTIHIGDEVTIGHGAVIHGCRLGNRVLVGMGAIVMDGAIVGDECIIGAGAIVTEATEIPRRSLVIGAPAKVRRELREGEIAELARSADLYAEKAQAYKRAGGFEGGA